ncbi:hypothetical protein [Hydrocarboniphaga effusa]|uniref:hypothetical protein n=1 Tax=Hydrocarboniphaga effusa TaxID=243629 RepID=UPI00398C0948
MSFAFATCDRRRALGFLKTIYPDREVKDTAEDAGPLLDLVEKDIVRISDPAMHGPNAAIIPSTNWNESRRSEVMDVCQRFHRGPVVETSNV